MRGRGSILLLLALPSATRSFHIPASRLRAYHSSSTILMSASSSSDLHFGPYKISHSQVFYETKLTRGIVNLKPIVPGHILVVPHRIVDRFSMLSLEEVKDLYQAVHEIGPILERHYRGEALTISMQDGVAAGQTVPHGETHALLSTPMWKIMLS